MMGCQSPLQPRLFYTTVSLEKGVRKDHALRKSAGVVDFDFPGKSSRAQARGRNAIKSLR